eukprot:CAMPEP_0168339532 /NCGR_PEP_ID=MMETSP0213-20121227/13509_1 /TAXON_ID=151035 /ORGANISM="Euplotes harpa, Strain FSP1.4" /LENGTH=119 /DNA_ID=CAMNT_0008345565 /DNA_START=476 /DNA_END=836 /DNA_ORIENTATION=-
MRPLSPTDLRAAHQTGVNALLPGDPISAGDDQLVVFGEMQKNRHFSSVKALAKGTVRGKDVVASCGYDQRLVIWEKGEVRGKWKVALPDVFEMEVVVLDEVMLVVMVGKGVLVKKILVQ